MDPQSVITLRAGTTCLILDARVGGALRILFWGIADPNTKPEDVLRLYTRQHAHGSPANEVPAALLNDFGSGFAGPPSIEVHRNGKDWAGDFRVRKVLKISDFNLQVICEDPLRHLRLSHSLILDPRSEILMLSASLSSDIDGPTEPVSVIRCDAACLPLPPHLSRLTGFTGRWANEFHTEEIPIFTGSYLRENRAGRTSHDCFPGLILSEDGAMEQAGLCYGLHLGWSGNHRMQVDRLSDGRLFAHSGALLLPGEIRLMSRGQSYSTPWLYCGLSNQGFSGLSQKFQDHVRRIVLPTKTKTKTKTKTSTKSKPRPVHYNTWEAVYFDLDESKLIALADKAADVGIERFVLDDGWFGGRRNDRAGLGDWQVSKDVFPNGLKPLIDHVKNRGMEFGLWVEPEMINPDSDLYRAHPDWALQVPGLEQIESRNQLVLDLTNFDAWSQIRNCLHELLTEYDITYLKWDMNRNIHHPGSKAISLHLPNNDGGPVAVKQTMAVYALIDWLTKAHPDLVIESCASGGGRADYGILLQRTERIWTSDSNDALDRQIIQRGASHFFPLEVLGAHVGPATCHITQRKLSMELRVATAVFGHMGVELNLNTASDDDLAVLKAGIALHKTHRNLIHSGEMFRLDTPEHTNAISVVGLNKREALLSWCQLTGHRDTLPGLIRFVGLDPSLDYRCRIIWPEMPRSQSSPSIIDTLDLAGDGAVFSGASLMDLGLQAPLLYPETCLIFHLEAIT